MFLPETVILFRLFLMVVVIVLVLMLVVDVVVVVIKMVVDIRLRLVLVSLLFSIEKKSVGWGEIDDIVVVVCCRWLSLSSVWSFKKKILYRSYSVDIYSLAVWRVPSTRLKDTTM
jgi:hypothetical protein